MSTVNKSTLVIVKNAHIALLNFNKFVILSCLNENCANSAVEMKKKQQQQQQLPRLIRS